MEKDKTTTTTGAEETEFTESTFEAELVKSQRLADLEQQLAHLAKQNAELLAASAQNRELSEWKSFVRVRTYSADDFVKQGPGNWAAIARNHARAQLAGIDNAMTRNPTTLDFHLREYTDAITQFARITTEGPRPHENAWQHSQRLADARALVKLKTMVLGIQPLLSGKDFNPDA